MAAFTAIAAGIGLATTAATTGMSFGQAAKQKRMAAQANKEANKAMKEARARLEVNYAEALSIPKEAYELEREALLSQGAQALDAARESERGSAATAGRVLAAQQQGQAQTRTAMAQDLFDIEAMKLEEESRLRDLNVQLDLEEIMGAQQKAADAQAAATAAKQAGIEGAISLGQQAMEFIPLYAQDRGAQKYAAEKAGLYTPGGDQTFRQFKKDNPQFKFDEGYKKFYYQATNPYDVAPSASRLAERSVAPATQNNKLKGTAGDFTYEELEEMRISDPVRYNSIMGF